MTDPLSTLDDAARGKLKQRPQPPWLSPMLATLTHEYFSDPKWIFERKLDGERCLAFRRATRLGTAHPPPGAVLSLSKGRRGDDLRLMSRNQKTMNDQYPELVAALRKQPAHDFIVDGEIVAFEGALTSFERLQNRMHVSNPSPSLVRDTPVYYYLFDLLYLNGCDTTHLPLRDRKRLLKAAFSFEHPLRFTIHRNRDGLEFYRQACKDGWEGLIAKRADSRYLGKRSTDWLKFKCVNEQEFVIGGYTDPQGSRLGFGALLIGCYEDGELRYAGKVGTGYDDETLERLSETLSRIETKKRPFVDGDFPRKGVHWVKPELVCQVGFTEWTPDGRLRHPRFLGLRDDKDPREVVRERPGG